jgi:hypothetical protein
MKQFIIVICSAVFLLAACTPAEPTKKVRAMQRKDKRLSCKEILLEMNEAEFYKRVAYRNKGPKLKNVLMPLGYISTYMDSNEAIEAADARISYLDQIYGIMKCDDEDRHESDESSYSIPVYN